MPSKRIGKNRKSFIKEILDNGKNFRVYTLENYFSGRSTQRKYAEKEFWEFRFAYLTADYETGKCTIHIHSNHWYYFNVDPAILKKGTPKRKPRKIHPAIKKIQAKKIDKKLKQTIKHRGFEVANIKVTKKLPDGNKIYDGRLKHFGKPVVEKAKNFNEYEQIVKKKLDKMWKNAQIYLS